MTDGQFEGFETGSPASRPGPAETSDSARPLDSGADVAGRDVTGRDITGRDVAEARAAQQGATEQERTQAQQRAATRRRLALRGTPPTDPMPMVDMLRHTPYREARVRTGQVAEERVREVVDLAARVGELMLRCGAGAPQVEGSIAAVAAAGGLSAIEVDITMQSLLLQASTPDGGQQTQVRVVRSTRTDYGRLVAVHEMVDALVEGDFDIHQAATELRLIKRRPRVWSNAIVKLATAALASAVALMIGGSPFVALVTLGVVLVVQLSGSKLSSFGLPDFYGNAIAAFVSTVLAWVAYATGALGWLPIGPNDFAFIVAGGIVAMLPGRTLASAVEDVLSGYPLTGSGRMFGTLIALSGLVIGIAFGISVTLRVTSLLTVGFVSPSVLDLRLTQASWPLALIGAFCIGATGAVTQQSRRLLILPVGLLCMTGVALLIVLVRVVDIGPITSTGLAAVLIGFLGRFVSSALRAPPLVVIAPATFGLLPGLTIFLGLYEMVGQADPGGLAMRSGLTTLLSAFAILLAIATGSTFGEILATPWDRSRVIRATRRLRG